jgi:hypothetical protein
MAGANPTEIRSRAIRATILLFALVPEQWYRERTERKQADE